MTTQAAMIAEIESDSERSDTAAIRLKIQQAIRHFQPMRFWFNETRSITFATVAGQTDYSATDIGADFYSVDAMYLIEAGGEVSEIKRHDYRWSETLEGNATNNQPYSWAYIDKTVRLYPPPAEAYTIRPTGHIKVDAPTGDDDAANAWFVYAYDLIMFRARAALEATRWDNPAGAIVFKQLEDIEYSKLVGETTMRIGTGAVIPTQF